MARYRIEVWILQEIVKVLETDDSRQAHAFYRLHNDYWDEWTQLYVEGKTGNKKWMDNQMKMAGKLPKLFR